MERCNFNGFNTFESIKTRINAKSFTRLLRVHDNNALHIHKQILIRQLNVWHKENNIKYCDPHTLKKIHKIIPAEHQNNILWNWFGAAKKLQCSDTLTYHKLKQIEQCAIAFIPSDLPKCIRFVPFSDMWKDEKMLNNVIYIILDGSVMYEDESDPAAHIFGYGGSALYIYYNNQIIAEITLPISTRTHINVMELYILYIAFDWITSTQNQRLIHNSNGICIISDSQNCINILSQKNTPKDDILINIYQQIDEKINILKTYQLPDEYIQIYWVHSHDESKLNDKIDEAAKIAAQIVKYNHNLTYSRQVMGLEENHNTEKMWLNPNSMISNNTVKSEIKYLANKMDETTWYEYKLGQINKWGTHYWKWYVPWAPKQFAKIIPFLTEQENNFRIMFLSNQIPTNQYMHYKAKNLLFEPFCDQHADCAMAQTEESMYHLLFECPAEFYLQERTHLIDTVMDIYQRYNRSINNEKKKIKIYQQNDDQSLFLKQFIFPPFKLLIEDRVAILKALHEYLLLTRKDILKRYLNDKCIRIPDKEYNERYGKEDY